jgi:hypothetical protein
MAWVTQATAGQGPVYKLLYSPPLGSAYGLLSGIFETKPGLFYVTSQQTSTSSGASIFVMTSTGSVSAIYSFPPQSSINVLQTTSGELYGSGYTNTPPYPRFYYWLNPSGQNLREYMFQSPWNPGFETTIGPPNEIFDMMGQPVTGGKIQWAFIRIAQTGAITILHQFSGSDGVPSAYAHLILGPDSNFYGIGAQSPVGISPMFIYRFTPEGTYSRLLTFSSVPGYDSFPLVAGSDGNLYGSFSKGGANRTGEIYQATLSGQFKVIASLPASISSPRTLMQAGDGNLYGTTVYNQIFRYEPATHAVKLVYQMDVAGSQGQCGCILVEGMDGKLYAVAAGGGNYPGVGAIFSLDIGLPRPQPAVTGLYPPSGAVGQKVILWGNYLLGASAVSFNGTPATSYKSTSVQSVYATVPSGATTGPVTITTANGSYTTTQSFTVQ